MSSAFLPLNVAVLGAGQIGSTFAFGLAHIGHAVTVIARPGSVRLQQLECYGAIIDVKGDRATVQVASTLDEQTSYDLLIVTLLAHQTDALLSTLQASAAKCILFMFNNFHPERLQDSIGAERCAFGMPFVQAKLGADGRLKATIGAGGQKTIISQQRWVDMFNAAGLPAALERDMPLWLRCHVPLCVAFESVSVTAMRRGGGVSWGEALVLARGVHASFDLIKGLGHSVYPKTKRRIANSPVQLVAAVLWFMSRIRSFRELLATGKAESCALVDAMLASVSLTEQNVMISEIQAMKPL